MHEQLTVSLQYRAEQYKEGDKLGSTARAGNHYLFTSISTLKLVTAAASALNLAALRHA